MWGDARAKSKIIGKQTRRPRLKGLLADGAVEIHFNANIEAGFNDDENDRS